MASKKLPTPEKAIYWAKETIRLQADGKTKDYIQNHLAISMPTARRYKKMYLQGGEELVRKTVIAAIEKRKEVAKINLTKIKQTNTDEDGLTSLFNRVFYGRKV